MKTNLSSIRERVEDGFTTFVIDTTKATLRDFTLLDTSNTGKRKFENLLIITRPRERLKFIYQV